MPRPPASCLTVTRTMHSGDVLCPSVAVTLAAKVPGRSSARFQRAWAPRPSMRPAVAVHEKRTVLAPDVSAHALRPTAPPRGTVGESALQVTSSGAAAPTLRVRLIAASRAAQAGNDPLDAEDEAGAEGDHHDGLGLGQRGGGIGHVHHRPHDEGEGTDGHDRADGGLHRALTLTRGRMPSSSPFITGCWLPPTERDFCATCCSRYWYSSWSVTMPSRSRSAAPRSPCTR